MQVLILSANTGEGHNSAALAAKEYLESRGWGCHVADGLSYMPKLENLLICKGHVFIYRRMPGVFGLGYRIAERLSRRTPFQKNLRRFRTPRAKKRPLTPRMEALKTLLNSGKYDAVICVHVFPANLISRLKSAGHIHIPVYFLATDYTCSPGVNQLDMTGWLIPHRKLVPEFVRSGIPREKLIPVGIPVRRKFYEKKDRMQARRELNLPPDKRIAVLSCGSMGAGAMGRMVLALAELLPPDALLVVICGSNKSLKRRLDRVKSRSIKVLGYTKQMHDYLDAADLFITKAGGLSTTEAICKRVPMLLINAVPGLETRNMEFMKALGCAVTVSGPINLARTVSLILRSGESMEALVGNCRREFDRPAAELLWQVLQSPET